MTNDIVERFMRYKSSTEERVLILLRRNYSEIIPGVSGGFKE